MTKQELTFHLRRRLKNFIKGIPDDVEIERYDSTLDVVNKGEVFEDLSGNPELHSLEIWVEVSKNKN